MPIEIRMPALSPTMTEGNLARWLKREGDTVSAGDVIAEIETDKATMEIEAVEEGRLGKILIARRHRGRRGQHADRAAARGGRGRRGARRASMQAVARRRPRRSSRPGRQPAPIAQPGLRPKRLRGDASARRERRARAMAPIAAGGSSPARSRGGWPSRPGSTSAGSRAAGRTAGSSRSTSSARSGTALRPKPRRPPRQTPTAMRPEAPAARAPSPMPAAPPPAAAYTEQPLSNMRKVIARRLTEAKQTIPHFYLSMDCELDALLKLRSELNRARGRRLQALGQRLRDQGGGARAAQGARRPTRRSAATGSIATTTSTSGLRSRSRTGW